MLRWLNGLIRSHTMSLCRVCFFILYLSVYLGCVRCVFRVLFHIRNHFLVFSLLFLRFQQTPMSRCLLMYTYPLNYIYRPREVEIDIPRVLKIR